MEARALTLATPEGELIIRVNQHTHYRVPEVENPSLRDIRIGDVVTAFGQPDGRGHWIARVVSVIPPERFPVRLKGEVTAVAEDSLTLNTRHGEFTVRPRPCDVLPVALASTGLPMPVPDRLPSTHRDTQQGCPAACSVPQRCQCVPAHR